MNALQETDVKCMQGLNDYLASLQSSSIQVIMPKGVSTTKVAKELFSHNVEMPLLKCLVQNHNERWKRWKMMCFLHFFYHIQQKTVEAWTDR